MKKFRIPFFLFILLIFLIVISCNNDEEVKPHDIDNIRLELVEQKEDLNGMIYTLRIENNSNHVIIQNNVYVSFPILIENGTRSNEFKVESKNNKLNIKPKEEVLLTAFATKEMYEGISKIDINEPIIQINGYVDEVTELNHFHKGGGYKAMIDY